MVIGHAYGIYFFCCAVAIPGMNPVVTISFIREADFPLAKCLHVIIDVSRLKNPVPIGTNNFVTPGFIPVIELKADPEPKVP